MIPWPMPRAFGELLGRKKRKEDEQEMNSEQWEEILMDLQMTPHAERNAAWGERYVDARAQYHRAARLERGKKRKEEADERTDPLWHTDRRSKRVEELKKEDDKEDAAAILSRLGSEESRRPQKEEIPLFGGRILLDPRCGMAELMNLLRGHCIIDLLGDAAYVKIPGGDFTTYRIDFEGDQITRIVKIRDRHDRDVREEVWPCGVTRRRIEL